jgi:hypothetical protein
MRAGSILGLTVIVVSFFESVFADHSKEHPVAVAYFGDRLTGEPYTTLPDSTSGTRWRKPRRLQGAWFRDARSSTTGG